jgi:hypothetical protein
LPYFGEAANLFNSLVVKNHDILGTNIVGPISPEDLQFCLYKFEVLKYLQLSRVIGRWELGCIHLDVERLGCIGDASRSLRIKEKKV